jgi:hypothetical protein
LAARERAGGRAVNFLVKLPQISPAFRQILSSFSKDSLGRFM